MTFNEILWNEDPTHKESIQMGSQSNDMHWNSMESNRIRWKQTEIQWKCFQIRAKESIGKAHWTPRPVQAVNISALLHTKNQFKGHQNPTKFNGIQWNTMKFKSPTHRINSNGFKIQWHPMEFNEMQWHEHPPYKHVIQMASQSNVVERNSLKLNGIQWTPNKYNEISIPHTYIQFKWAHNPMKFKWM